MSDTVLCDIRDGVALLTLNRPAKLNALNYELIDCLIEVLDIPSSAITPFASLFSRGQDERFPRALTSQALPRA
jgi:hypothetical protein